MKKLLDGTYPYENMIDFWQERKMVLYFSKMVIELKKKQKKQKKMMLWLDFLLEWA